MARVCRSVFCFQICSSEFTGLLYRIPELSSFRLRILLIFCNTWSIKELEGKKIKMTRSMDAEGRFQKEWDISVIHVDHDISCEPQLLELVSLNSVGHPVFVVFLLSF